MKKKLLLLGLIGVVPFMTGCGSVKSKMVCVMEDVDIVEKIEFSFDGDDKLLGGSIEETIDYKNMNYSTLFNCDTIEACISQDEERAKSICDNGDYSNCQHKGGETTSTITAEFTEQGLEEFSTPAGSTKGKVKEVAENGGFKCE